MSGTGAPVFTFQVSTEDLTATVQTDGPVHPDLLDSMCTRCVELFTRANESLPAEADGDDAEA